MDSSLASISDLSPQRRGVPSGETSRCSRCVKDKKGCDRRFPCTRCVESGNADSCLYTGSIQIARLQTTPHVGKLRTQSSLEAHIIADEENVMEQTSAEPEISRPKRAILPESTRTATHRGWKRRKMQSLPLDHQEEDTNWYREPPEKIEIVHSHESEISDAELHRIRILRSFTDAVTHLPIELYRSTNYIRALDAAYVMKTKELDDLCRELQNCPQLARSLELRSRMCTLMKESRTHRWETIAEVAKLQNFVEIQSSLLHTEIEKVENPHKRIPQFLEERKDETGTTTITKHSKKPKKKAGEILRDTADGFDIPIAEDEPTYCYCDRVSFGKMIACENEACAGGEWFHFECLGIKAPPRGKWWCTDCQDMRSRQQPDTRPQERIPQNRTRKTNKVIGETVQEKRNRIREENRSREATRRARLQKKRL